MHHGTVTPEIAQGLLALRKRIAAAKIPPSKVDETINVAVWNVREFGKSRRSEAAVHYIAEMLGQFDLVALGTGGTRCVTFPAIRARCGGMWCGLPAPHLRRAQAGKPVSLSLRPPLSGLAASAGIGQFPLMPVTFDMPEDILSAIPGSASDVEARLRLELACAL